MKSDNKMRLGILQTTYKLLTIIVLIMVHYCLCGQHVFRLVLLFRHPKLTEYKNLIKSSENAFTGWYSRNYLQTSYNHYVDGCVLS
jgi:hypothetical protein